MNFKGGKKMKTYPLTYAQKIFGVLKNSFQTPVLIIMRVHWGSKKN